MENKRYKSTTLIEYSTHNEESKTRVQKRGIFFDQISPSYVRLIHRRIIILLLGDEKIHRIDCV